MYTNVCEYYNSLNLYIAVSMRVMHRNCPVTKFLTGVNFLSWVSVWQDFLPNCLTTQKYDRNTSLGGCMYSVVSVVLWGLTLGKSCKVSDIL